MYADTMTRSMKAAIDETYRRRAIQLAHNETHGIEPRGIVKEIKDLTDRVKAVAEERAEYQVGSGNGNGNGKPGIIAEIRGTNWRGWSRMSKGR
jgi:excinuclease ABC subunit B